ncbi:FecR family protein [Dysgonomonas sp.]|jgi:hypothetical protein|nr:FecR family protein [Prevotella sp.]
MTKKYQYNNMSDFLKDDFFIDSTLNPTDKTDFFWNKLIEDGLIDIDEFNKAKNALTNPSYSSSPKDIDNEVNALWNRINTTNTINSRKKKVKLYIAYSAAAVACFIGLFLFVDKQIPLHNNTEILASDYDFSKVSRISPSGNEVELIVNDSNEIKIVSDSVHIRNTQGGVHVNNDLVVEKDLDKVNYLQLIVPRGKRSKIDLIDGSFIIVNAGTRVIYPDKFIGNKREIYVDGEIYAKIAHDEDKPFVVRTNNLSLQVLGTTFDISAYESETSKSIVLVEGSVKVISHQPNVSDAILKPNQQYYIDRDESRITTVNPENHISWTEGIYRFKKESLKNILSRVAKYYGVTIRCDSPSQDKICSGSLDLKDDINAVLYDISLTTSLTCTYVDNEYQFK